MNFKKTIPLLTLILISFSNSFAQKNSDEKVFGLGATLQGPQVGILVPIWMSQKFVIAPAIDLSFAEKTSTDLGIALKPKFYFSTNSFSPYFGFTVGVLVNIPSKDENLIDNGKKVDLIGGIAFGGEYFFNSNFSLGVEAQANVAKAHKDSHRFGNPDGVNFNLATAVFAHIYFTR